MTTAEDIVRSGPRVYRDARAILAESLWWDPSGVVHWCDITAGTLHASPVAGDPDGSRDAVVALAPPVACFQPTDDGRRIVALGDEVVIGGSEGEPLESLASIPHRHAGIRLNEGKCDPAGRFVVGSMNVTGGDPDAAIYSVLADGSARTILGGIGVSNGFEWSDDGTRMYFADTSVQTVYVGDYDASGELTGVEPFLTGRTFDGLALDADGHFWTGIYREGTVARWTPDGRKEFELELPAGHVTSVAFGGPDLSTLFVATAREQLDEGQLERLPLSGAIFAIETGTRGRAVNRFRTTTSRP